MNILHVVAGDLNGGAARGAYWLHRGLTDVNVCSKIITSSRDTLGDNCVISTNVTVSERINVVIQKALDRMLVSLYPKRNRFIFSTGMFGVDFTKSRTYRDADLVHLHWINGAYVNIKDLRKVKKPMVWTMRDMWPFTGGCHIAAALGCDKYKNGCGKCVQLKSNNEKDLSWHVLDRKKRYLPLGMKIVGISKWLSDRAKESELFGSYDVRTISNNIDTTQFYKINSDEAKKKLGLTSNKKIVLTGSTNADHIYKGFKKYLDAVKLLDKEKYLLCFFGKLSNNLIENLGFEFKSLGYLDNNRLRLAYNCADVFAAASIMEPFGKTLAESMACGTPVVCFDATGPKDIVTHKNDGYKAIPFSSEDLAKGIEWLANNRNYDKLSENAVQKAREEFDSSVIAQKYISLYREVLNA